MGKNVIDWHLPCGIEHSGFDSDSSRILAVARGVRKGLITRTDLQLILTF